MPKPNLKSLSVDDLMKLRTQVQTALEGRRKELEGQLARLGNGSGKRTSILKGKKAPVKYRGPRGETWAGRGATPKWMRELLRKGKKKEDFAVGR